VKVGQTSEALRLQSADAIRKFRKLGLRSFSTAWEFVAVKPHNIALLRIQLGFTTHSRRKYMGN